MYSVGSHSLLIAINISTFHSKFIPTFVSEFVHIVCLNVLLHSSTLVYMSDYQVCLHISQYVAILCSLLSLTWTLVSTTPEEFIFCDTESTNFILLPNSRASVLQTPWPGSSYIHLIAITFSHLIQLQQPV